jgi:regulation of enolase protein 1 (concanavalin A-like superfamily)
VKGSHTKRELHNVLKEEERAQFDHELEKSQMKLQSSLEVKKTKKLIPFPEAKQWKLGLKCCSSSWTTSLYVFTRILFNLLTNVL